MRPWCRGGFMYAFSSQLMAKLCGWLRAWSCMFLQAWALRCRDLKLSEKALVSQLKNRGCLDLWGCRGREFQCSAAVLVDKASLWCQSPTKITQGHWRLQDCIVSQQTVCSQSKHDSGVLIYEVVAKFLTRSSRDILHLKHDGLPGLRRVQPWPCFRICPSRMDLGFSNTLRVTRRWGDIRWVPLASLQMPGFQLACRYRVPARQLSSLCWLCVKLANTYRRVCGRTGKWT